ncbi:hypothetical protein SLG_03910 [Sphingobium sp. SYK-6]|uniref:hypothetical protein n=1 Tax=Sphingobium sp. (strain NBRC 103272 / SYK-6) TaxID=627192 RepID=UPI0002276E93|nr:hypothetical protein [Sphingobium sp. SYK-6]BAK65066.1 hypothetical protein SLG_03910 [Sphingobium sp. SYK-6]
MELLEWLNAGFDLFGDKFGDTAAGRWLDHGLSALSLLLFLFALALIYQEFLRCYRLLRRMNPNVRRGSRLQVAESVLLLAITDRALLSRDRRTLLRRTRILVEHELFVPRPQPDWRDGGVDAPEGGFLGRQIWRMGGRWRAWRAYRAELHAWRQDIRRALALEGNWTIHVDNPALVSARLDDIGRYFECLRSLGLDGEEADRFICPIEIGSGFIAPLHLLTGLLIQFNDKWRPILESFDRDANSSAEAAGRPIDATDRDLRQIQLFIYNCWLLWGPSIPICECRNWDARYAVVQYGYGDENNSIEVVGSRRDIAAALKGLMDGQCRHERAIGTVGATPPPEKPFTGMAVPANVMGRLRLSRSLGRRTASQVNALPQAALTSWGGGQDERPVLFISEIVSSNAVEGDVERREASRGHIVMDTGAYPSRYYSAYLWAAVVVLMRGPDGRLTPLTSLQPGPAQPWKDFIPFFEHGNLADPESCLFGKRQLALKVVSGLAAAVRQWGTDREPLTFAFACAIDEAGCGHRLAYPDWSGHFTMRTLIAEALDSLAESDAAARRLRDDKLLRFDYFNGQPGGHDFSACGFPGIVSAHYDWMDEATASRSD